MLGWAYDDSQEIFDIPEELVQKFDLAKVSKNPAIFDMQKFEWMNGVHIRELDTAELAKRALPLMQRAGLLPQSVPTDLMDRYVNVVKEVQVRIKTLNDIVGATRFFFADEIDYDEKIDQLRRRCGGEAAGHADVVQRPGVVEQAEQQRPDALPSLCQRNPATTQSAVRSCLTFHMTRLSCWYGRSAGLAITPSNPAPSKRVNQSSATSGSSVSGREVDRRVARRRARSPAGAAARRTARR